MGREGRGCILLGMVAEGGVGAMRGRMALGSVRGDATGLLGLLDWEELGVKLEYSVLEELDEWFQHGLDKCFQRELLTQPSRWPGFSGRSACLQMHRTTTRKVMSCLCEERLVSVR
jgi:hypothetical protein